MCSKSLRRCRCCFFSSSSSLRKDILRKCVSSKCYICKWPWHYFLVFYAIRQQCRETISTPIDCWQNDITHKNYSVFPGGRIPLHIFYTRNTHREYAEHSEFRLSILFDKLEDRLMSFQTNAYGATHFIRRILCVPSSVCVHCVRGAVHERSLLTWTKYRKKQVNCPQTQLLLYSMWVLLVSIIFFLFFFVYVFSNQAIKIKTHELSFHTHFLISP